MGKRDILDKTAVTVLCDLGMASVHRYKAMSFIAFGCFSLIQFNTVVVIKTLWIRCCNR